MYKYKTFNRSSGSIGEGVRIPGLAGSIEGVRLTTAVNNAATGSIEGGRHATSGSHTMQRNRKSTNSQHSLLTLPRSHSSYRQQFSSATAIAPPSRVTPSGVLGEHAGTVPHTAQPPPSSALSSTQHSPLEDSGLPRRKQFQVNILLGASHLSPATYL